MLTRLRQTILALSRRQKIAVMVLTDLVALPACLLAAFYLRLGDASLLYQYGITAPLIMAFAAIPVFYLCGLYHSVVRYIDTSALKVIGIGLSILTIGTYVATTVWTGAQPPRSSFLIYWFIAFVYVIVSRFGAR